jgi:diacylglycerol kinase (ATP)
MRKARIIYNPSSGREVFKKHLPDCLNLLEQAGCETSCHATSGPHDATVAAKKAVDRGFDMVVAAGGDGTVNEVINGLAGKTYRPKLGIIPAGTTNDFARALGIPKDFQAASRILVNGKPRPIDIGRANKHILSTSPGEDP